MAHYLVIHTPIEEDAGRSQPPSRMADLARIHGPNGARPRWLKSWSPDLHDNRLFTYWESDTAADILATIAAFDFLSEMEAKAISVREWGPQDVLDAIREEDDEG